MSLLMMLYIFISVFIPRTFSATTSADVVGKIRGIWNCFGKI